MCISAVSHLIHEGPRDQERKGESVLKRRMFLVPLWSAGVQSVQRQSVTSHMAPGFVLTAAKAGHDGQAFCSQRPTKHLVVFSVCKNWHPGILNHVRC